MENTVSFSFLPPSIVRDLKMESDEGSPRNQNREGKESSLVRDSKRFFHLSVRRLFHCSFPGK